MHVEVLPTGSDNYTYLIIDDDLGTVVDPMLADPALKAAERLNVRIKNVLVTHHHGDHCGGCPEIKAVTGCMITGPAGSNIPGLTHPVSEGDRISTGHSELTVMEVPGHTKDHVAYYNEKDKMVFTGDTLFVAGCGRPFECSPEELWLSLKKLRELPGDTKVYCGHEYTIESLEFALHLEPGNMEVKLHLQDIRNEAAAGRPSVPSTIEMERLTNPFLRVDDIELCKATGMEHMTDAEVFTAIRQQKNRW